MNAARLNPYAPFVPTEPFQTPFPYLTTKQSLATETQHDLLQWLEQRAPWNLVETDFYEQFEFDMRGVELPPTVTSLVSVNALDGLRVKMETAFKDRLLNEVQVVAHRLEQGQRIGIHNDMREGGETHRLTIQLNRGLTDDDGGFFMLFNSEEPEDVHRILRPISGSAVAFAISSNSHHAVSRVHGGVRFTLVYSFYAVRG